LSPYPVGPGGLTSGTSSPSEEVVIPYYPKIGPPGVPTIKDKITSMMGIEHLRCHMASAWIGFSLTFP